MKYRYLSSLLLSTLLVTLSLTSLLILSLTTQTASASSSVYNMDKGTWYTTIQAAVDNADSGNTILVYPGTFDEQVVINNKSLTLEGSGDSSVVKPSSQSKLTSLYTYPENLPYMGGKKVASIILVENAGGTSVTIENLKVDGLSVTTLPAGANILAGVLYGESGGKIQNVTVDNIKTTGYADRTYGIDLAATGSAVSVEVYNNRIKDWARNGINANGAGLTVNIHGNTLTGPSIQLGTQVPNGIVLWADLVGTVSGNTVSSCHELSDNISGTSWLSTGIMAYKTLGPGGAVIENNEVYDVDMGVDTTTCIIRNNNLHGNGMGVVLEQGAGNNQVINNNIWNNAVGIQICGALNPNPTGKDPPTANNFAHFNIISGNTSGFVNYDNTQKFDARFNWWGNASGPGGAGPGTGDNITENVRYSPWLGFTVGTVPMTFHVDNTGTIQSAIDAASSGDTIIVHSGTYGPFTVNGKSNLTIKAASVPIVEGVQSASTRNRGNTDTVVWIRDSTNIVLVGLDIEGSGLGTINGTSYGIFIENSSGTVENCKVSPNTVGNMYSLAIGIYDGSNVTIDPCIIENYGRLGIHVYNGCTVNVFNSTIIGQVYNDVNLVNYGIEVEGAKYNDDPATASHATIIGNEIYNCNNLASSPKWSSDAIDVNGWLEYGPEADSTVVIEKNNIHNNWGGIEVCKSPSSYAHFNSIHNNLTYGVLNVNAYDDTSATFNATCNWWGDTSGPYNPTTNPSGLGDSVSDNVIYVGWARAPIGTVWVGISPSSQSGANGVTLNYTVTVQNPDNVSHTFDLTDNAGPSWLPSLVENSLTIPPNENGTATFSVTVPSNAIGGTIDNIKVTATSQDNAEVSASASCTATVAIARGVEVIIEPKSQFGSVGENVVFTITVKNIGNYWDNFKLDNSPSYHTEIHNQDEFSQQVFNVTLNHTIDRENKKFTWTVDLSNIEGHWSTGVQVMIANGTEPAFSLGWSPGFSTTNPVYRPYIHGSGWGTATTTLPDGMSVSGNYNENHYVIEVPVEYIPLSLTSNNKLSYYWAINTEASWPGHSGSVQQNYPANWVRWTATNTAEGIIPIGGVRDTAGWALKLDNAYLEIPGNESRETKLTVFIPDNENLVLTTDNVTVFTTSQADYTVSAENYCTVSMFIRNVEVSISPALDNGLVKNVTITNTGTVIDNYDLIAEDNAGWGLMLAKDFFGNVMPGENRVTTLNITIPPYTKSGTVDGITVIATSKVDPEVNDNASAQVTAFKGVEVTISPTENWGARGTRMIYTVTVKNMGNTWDNYRLNKSDVLGWMISENFAWIPLQPNDYASVIIDVTIPENVVPYSVDNLIVTATSLTEPAINDTSISKAFGPNLVTGWNLVCFTGASGTDTPNSLFSNMNYITDYVVYWWEAPGGPYHLQGPDEVFKDNLGYWISTNKDEAYRTTGVEPTSRDINLIPGWNLVGFPITNENTTPNNIFTGLNYLTDYFIYHWTAPGGPYVLMGPGEVFENVLGYWVWIDQDMTVTVP